MVATLPSSPKSLAGHRRSRSHSTSPGVVHRRTDDQRSRSPIRFRRNHQVQPRQVSHSDPVGDFQFTILPLFEELPSPRSLSHKRQRCDHIISPPPNDLHYSGSQLSVNSRLETGLQSEAAAHLNPIAASAPPTPFFLATSSHAFNLHASRRLSRSQKVSRRQSTVSGFSDIPKGNNAHLQDAYKELQRSVEDGEERFLTMMRELEQQQSRLCYPALSQRDTKTDPDLTSSGMQNYADEDDIDIILSNSASSHIDGSANSDMILIDPMDEDMQSSPSSFRESHSSDFSDEESTSMTSSFSSAFFEHNDLSNLSHNSVRTFQSSTLIPSVSSPSINPTPPSTRSDKAIAALTLALANGAAGLNDYHDILEIRGELHDQQAGELWK